MGGTKLIIASTIGAGILWALKYLSGKKNTGDKLDIQTIAHILPPKKTDLAVKLRLDVLLKNPTEGALTIKQPYVKVQFNGKDVATSQIINKEIEISAYSAKALDPIILTVPATGLFTLGDGLLKVLLKKEPAEITTLTTTSVKIGGNFISQTKPDVTILNSKA
jgi:hypothetical protein